MSELVVPQSFTQRCRAMPGRALLAACIFWFGLVQPAAAQDTKLTIGGTGAALSTMRLLAAAFEKANPGVTVNVLPSLGSTGGIRAVTTGAVDIGLSMRPLSQAERGQGARAVEYARAPVVFAVSGETRASEITTAQIVDIYAGKLTKWPSGDRIRVIMRPAGETHTKTLKGLSPQVDSAVSAAEKRRGMLFALTDQESIEQLDKIPGAMTVAALNELLAGGPRAKALKLNGVEPSAASLADGTYPLFSSFSLITEETPSPLAARFIDFVQSEPGRKILAETGHWVPSPSPARQP